MERRTTIIICGIVLFIVGIPLLFFVELVRGFGSSAGGDYYRMNTVELNLLECDTRSKDELLLSGITVIDTSAQYACSLKFGIDYYSQARANSGLYAALAPGIKGCKEKIDSISIFLLNTKTQQRTDLSAFMIALNDTLLRNHESRSVGYKLIYTKGAGNGQAYVFAGLKDLTYQFNASAGQVFGHMLEQTDVMFFFGKDFSKNFTGGTEACIRIKLSDGRVLKGVAGKAPRGQIVNKE